MDEVARNVWSVRTSSVGYRVMDVHRASATLGMGKPPKTNPELRYCEHDGCGKKLSMYNLKKLCWEHRPVTYGRVRGLARHDTVGVESD